MSKPGDTHHFNTRNDILSHDAFIRVRVFRGVHPCNIRQITIGPYFPLAPRGSPNLKCALELGPRVRAGGETRQRSGLKVENHRESGSGYRQVRHCEDTLCDSYDAILLFRRRLTRLWPVENPPDHGAVLAEHVFMGYAGSRAVGPEVSSRGTSNRIIAQPRRLTRMPHNHHEADSGADPCNPTKPSRSSRLGAGHARELLKALLQHSCRLWRLADMMQLNN